MTTAEIKELKAKGWELVVRDNPYMPESKPFYRLFFKSPRMEHVMNLPTTMEKEWLEVPYKHLMEDEKSAYVTLLLSRKRHEIDTQVSAFIASMIVDETTVLDPTKIKVDVELAYEDHS